MHPIGSASLSTLINTTSRNQILLGLQMCKLCPQKECTWFLLLVKPREWYSAVGKCMYLGTTSWLYCLLAYSMTLSKLLNLSSCINRCNDRYIYEVSHWLQQGGEKPWHHTWHTRHNQYLAPFHLIEKKSKPDICISKRWNTDHSNICNSYNQ